MFFYIIHATAEVLTHPKRSITKDHSAPFPSKTGRAPDSNIGKADDACREARRAVLVTSSSDLWRRWHIWALRDGSPHHARLAVLRKRLATIAVDAQWVSPSWRAVIAMYRGESPRQILFAVEVNARFAVGICSRAHLKS
jgi:hypothetical protein